MKKSVIYILAAAASLCLPACKKFLNVQPIDKLTGNNFYQSKDDVVANIYDMSRTFFGKINETHFIGATGEYRSGEVLSEPQADNGPARAYVEVLGRNDLLGLINGNPPWNFLQLLPHYRLDRLLPGNTKCQHPHLEIGSRRTRRIRQRKKAV